MPAPHAKPEGAPVWLELTAPDADVAAAFYGELLGVTFGVPDERFPDLRSIDHAGGMLGLLVPGEADPGWLVFLLASDADDGVRSAVAEGGELLVPVQEAEGMGRWAVLRDPSGARVALWEPWGLAGTAVEDEPGAPGWYELHTTRNYRETVRFYERGLGWPISTTGDSDDFRMVTHGEGEAAEAGIYDGSVTEAGTPSRWQPYFVVADADAAAETIRARGGTVLDGPDETPFGRLGHALDPAGGAFAFFVPPAR